MLSLEEGRLREDLTAFSNCLKGGSSETGVCLFFQVTSNRSRRNGLRLHERRCRLDIRENFLTERFGKIWNRLLKEVVESPSLDVFKRCVDVVLGNMV